MFKYQKTLDFEKCNIKSPKGGKITQSRKHHFTDTVLH